MTKKQGADLIVCRSGNVWLSANTKADVKLIAPNTTAMVDAYHTLVGNYDY